jgi:hypothetical protein
MDSQVQWITVEQWAALLPVPDSIAFLKRLLNPNLPKRTCAQYIHPDDVIRVKGIALIRYSPFPYRGESFPRWMDKT